MRKPYGSKSAMLKNSRLKTFRRDFFLIRIYRQSTNQRPAFNVNRQREN